MVVGADIQHHRQGVCRADPAAGGIQRKFTDRNPHPADTLVTEAQNTLAVRYHDHFDVVVRHVLQDVIHVMAVLIRDEYPARTTINLGETLTGRADGRGVNHRHHLFEVILYQTVEKGFVGVLDVAQVDVFVDFGFEALVLDPGAFGLLFDGFDHFRQQAKQVKTAALFRAEGAAFIQQRELQQYRPRVGDIKGTMMFCFVVHVTHSIF
ncbi:hypothetical protein D3C72_1445630 [compost metagenome]